jgi:dipeptidase
MPAAIGCVYWRTTAAPYTSLLTPWYLGITSAPPDYSRPATLEQAVSLDHHFEPPSGTFDTDPTQAWWKFKRLQDVVRQDFGNRIVVVRAAQEAFERELFESQAMVERRALELWQTDRDAARKYLTEYCAESADRACQEAERMAVQFTRVR